MRNSAWTGRFKAIRRDERATGAIEFGLFGPLLIILLVGVFEIGFAMYGAMKVNNATEAGLIYASKNGWDQAGIANAVESSSSASKIQASPAPTQFCGCPSSSGVNTVSCNATCSGGDPPGEYIRIEATLDRTTLFSNTGLTLPDKLTAQAILRQK
ncbi:MAG TPA: TadE/TadG family type IV pilus assembly protein [Hyphomicrobiales bacterium]|nr:TadE/TadG family type IV pilus assembly protein [Hyphomicrobiales bacterium]